MRSNINMYNEVKESAWTNFWDNANRLVPFVVVIAFVILISRSKDATNRLRNNKSFTTGEVTSFTRRVKGSGGDFIFTYWINGVSYSGFSVVFNIDLNKGHLLVGKKFPVIYDSTDLENSAILITESDYLYYKISIPDSLDWIKSYQR